MSQKNQTTATQINVREILRLAKDNQQESEEMEHIRCWAEDALEALGDTVELNSAEDIELSRSYFSPLTDKTLPQ